MVLVRIYRRHSMNICELKDRLDALFSDERTIRRITHVKEDEPAYIEIKEFFASVLREIS